MTEQYVLLNYEQLLEELSKKKPVTPLIAKLSLDLKERPSIETVLKDDYKKLNAVSIPNWLFEAKENVLVTNFANQYR